MLISGLCLMNDISAKLVQDDAILFKSVLFI